MNKQQSAQLEAWEREVLADHRWGQHGDQMGREVVVAVSNGQRRKRVLAEIIGE